MKKVNSLVLSTLTAAFLVGCGGGGGSSSTDTKSTTDITSATSTTSVPVTKGPLLQAMAKDKNGKIGTQIAGTNKYEFTGVIDYPITVEGGYVDVNDNGVVDSGDYAFTGKLSSYSTVVTPITTYLGDTSKDDGKGKLAELKILAGITSDDDLLKKDPSEVSAELLSLNAAIYQTYKVLMDKDTNNDEDIITKVLSDEYTNYKSSTNGSTNLTDALAAVEVKLRGENVDLISVLTELDVKKMNLSKKDFIGKKLVVANETYYFRENDIVLGDAGDDNSQILSYGDLENGTLKVKFLNGDYDLIALTEAGYDISNFEEGVLSSSSSITSSLVTYTQDELTQVLADIPFVLTTAMFSNKTFKFSADDGSIVLTLNSDGTGTEVGDDYTENLTWSIHGDMDQELKLVTGSDNSIEIYTFASTPSNGVKAVGGNVSDEPFEVTISEFVNIENILTTPSFVLTSSMLSGKEIYVSDDSGTGTFQFKVDGSYYEEWTVLDNSTENGNCTGTWTIGDNNKVTITNGSCSDAEPAGYTIFNEEPRNGSKFIVNYEEDGIDGTTYLETVVITSITNISTSSSATSTSFVSGKSVVVYDDEGDITVSFNSNGTYTENGGSWSCSGKWLDFGNNKIGLTCDTTNLPDGKVDDNEKIAQFDSNSPKVGDSLIVKDVDGSWPMEIRSISNL